jgi:hypothetical protein
MNSLLPRGKITSLVLENKLQKKSWNLLDENEVLFDDDGSRIIGDNPIKTAGELIPDDLAVLLPDPVKSEEDSKQTTKDRGIREEYRLVAGSICTAGFWRLKDKIGRTLREIHLNGKVPQYETKLEFPMNKFFSKLAPNHPVGEYQLLVNELCVALTCLSTPLVNFFFPSSFCSYLRFLKLPLYV